MRFRNELLVAACVLAATVVVKVAPAWQGPPAAQGAGPAGAQGQGGGRATFPAQQRPPGDPAVVARGKQLYGVSCQACHGADLRGGDQGGPNLLRSQVLLNDQDGELIRPIVRGSRAATGMDAIDIPDADIVAIAVYLHSVAATMQGQGGPPRGGSVPPNEAVLVGNVNAGRAYFTAKCSTCHSVTGNLAGISAKYPDARNLQNAWVAGGAGGGRGGRGGADAAGLAVTVRMSNGQTVTGTLERIDDFIVIVRLANGATRSIARNGAIPKVEITDPLAAHKALLTTLTDKDMHDVTAYLASIK